MAAAADHKGVSKLSRAILAKIHIAVKELAIEQEDYRDILERTTGKRSARDLTDKDLPRLDAELRRLGWTGRLVHSSRSGDHKKYDELGDRLLRPNPAQLRMLEVRFKSIPGYGTINPEGAYKAFLSKRFGISHPKMLDNKTFEAALTAVKRMEKA